MRVPVGSLLACVVALGTGPLIACASLPVDTAASFRTLAQATTTNFDQLSTSENDALKKDQLGEIANRRKRLLLPRACFEPESGKDPCFLVAARQGVTDPAQGLGLIPRTPRLEQLVVKVSAYAGSMSDLATAKDLDAANSAAGNAAASLKALVSSVYPPAAAVGPVIDALVFGEAQLTVAHRRAVMLRIATAAQPVIEHTAAALTEETTQLRATLIDIDEKRLMALMTQFNADEQRPAMSVSDRTALLADIDTAATDLSTARAIPTDFSSLPAAHEAVVRALENPGIDVTASVTNAEAFLTIVRSLSPTKDTTSSK